MARQSSSTSNNSTPNSPNLDPHPEFQNDCMPISLFLDLYFDDWSQYSSVQMVFMTIYFLTFAGGLFSNSLVIFAVVRKPQLQNVRNVFIVGLAIANIFICFTSLIITAITDLWKEWLFGEFLCHISPLFQAVGITVSTFSLTCIALDRYILIVHPAWQPIRAKHAVILMIGVWSLAVAIALPSALSQRLLKIEKPYLICEQFCYERWEGMFLRKEVYSVSVLFAQFIIPVLLMSYWYARIAWKLKRQHRFRQQRRLQRESASGRRIIRIVIIMYTTFVLSWSLYSIMTLLVDFNALPRAFQDQNFFCHLVAHSLAMTSVIWNPLLYGFANENFKRAFIEMLPCFARFVAVATSLQGLNSSPTRRSIQQSETLSLVLIEREQGNKTRKEENVPMNGSETKIGQNSIPLALMPIIDLEENAFV